MASRIDLDSIDMADVLRWIKTHWAEFCASSEWVHAYLDDVDASRTET